MSENFRERLKAIHPVTRIFVERQGDLAMCIGQALEKRGMTHDDLARASGIPKYYIDLFASGGGNPQLYVLARLEAALGEPLVHIYNKGDEGNPQWRNLFPNRFGGELYDPKGEVAP